MKQSTLAALLCMLACLLVMSLPVDAAARAHRAAAGPEARWFVNNAEGYQMLVPAGLDWKQEKSKRTVAFMPSEFVEAAGIVVLTREQMQEPLNVLLAGVVAVRREMGWTLQARHDDKRFAGREATCLIWEHNPLAEEDAIVTVDWIFKDGDRVFEVMMYARRSRLKAWNETFKFIDQNFEIL